VRIVALTYASRARCHAGTINLVAGPGRPRRQILPAGMAILPGWLSIAGYTTSGPVRILIS
jgi:hypothetical protein